MSKIEKSKLESYNDKILFKVLTEIDKEINGDKYVSLDDSKFSEVSDDVCKLFGIGHLDWLDIDFLITLYRDNIKQIVEKKLSSPLSRPQVGEYSIDVDIHSTEYVRRTYQHKTTSYSEKNVIPQMDSLDYEGAISVWDGYEIDYDIYDSETTSTKWDKHSVKLIKK